MALTNGGPDKITPANIAGFFAYPAKPDIVSGAIERAITRIPTFTTSVHLKGWREIDIPGRFISEQVLEEIDRCDCLIADTTTLNFNVIYELGFAIGRGKRVFVVRNRSITADPDTSQLGIVDTIGYKDYSNSDELAQLVAGISNLKPLSLANQRLLKAPIYLNQSKHRTDQDSAIISGVKKLGFKFRSFDPSETPRLSAFDAIKEVSQSYGVVVHLVPNEIDGARVTGNPPTLLRYRPTPYRSERSGFAANSCFHRRGVSSSTFDAGC